MQMVLIIKPQKPIYATFDGIVHVLKLKLVYKIT